MLSPIFCFIENSPFADKDNGEEEEVVEGTDSTEEDDGGSKNISPSSSMNPLAN
jgi:hypothetical protein